ncbi:MAG: formyltransferase family protein, partial [Syntrophobacteraceae bacterium]
MAHLTKKLRLAVLVSGGGTNLQSMIDRGIAGTMAADIAVVLSDRPDAHGLKRAEKAGIPAFCVNYKSYMDRDITAQIERDLSLDKFESTQKILKEPDPIRRRQRLARLLLAERELV